MAIASVASVNPDRLFDDGIHNWSEGERFTEMELFLRHDHYRAYIRVSVCIWFHGTATHMCFNCINLPHPYREEGFLEITDDGSRRHRVSTVMSLFFKNSEIVSLICSMARLMEFAELELWIYGKSRFKDEFADWFDFFPDPNTGEDKWTIPHHDWVGHVEYAFYPVSVWV